MVETINRLNSKNVVIEVSKVFPDLLEISMKIGALSKAMVKLLQMLKSEDLGLEASYLMCKAKTNLEN